MSNKTLLYPNVFPDAFVASLQACAFPAGAGLRAGAAGDWAQAARLFSQAAKVNAVQRSSAGRPAAQRRQKPPPGAMQRRF